jgi:hypothetical protein
VRACACLSLRLEFGHVALKRFEAVAVAFFDAVKASVYLIKTLRGHGHNAGDALAGILEILVNLLLNAMYLLLNNWLRVLGTAELAQIDQRVCQR